MGPDLRIPFPSGAPRTHRAHIGAEHRAQNYTTLAICKIQKFWCFFVQHLFFQKKSSKSKVGTKGHLWKTGYFEDISFMDIWATNPRFSSLTTSSCPNNDPMGTTRWGFFFKGRVGRFMVGAHSSVFTGGRV